MHRTQVFFRHLRIAPPSLLALLLFVASPAAGEMQTFTITGEYRVTDKDSPGEAERRAVLAARRQALEQAWAYLLGVAELKAAGLSRENVQEYTQGLFEFSQEAAQSVREGESVVVRMDVRAKIDPVLVLRRINAVRQSQNLGD